VKQNWNYIHENAGGLKIISVLIKSYPQEQKRNIMIYTKTKYANGELKGENYLKIVINKKKEEINNPIKII